MNRFMPVSDEPSHGRGLRSEPRYDCLIPCAVFAGGKGYYGACRNLSTRGMFLRIKGPLPVKQKYAVVLAHGEQGHLLIDVLEKSRRIVTKQDGRYLDLGTEIILPDPAFEKLHEHYKQVALSDHFDPLASDLSSDFDQRVNQQEAREIDPGDALPLFEESKQKVGPFELLEKLGRGSIGTTFRVRNDAGKVLALKVIHGQHVRGAGALEAWKTYLRQMQDTHHNAMVPILEVGMLQGKHLYYTMPYYQAKSLVVHAEGAARDGRVLHSTHVVRWLDQILDVLNVMHHRNRYHLNLKPSNVLLNDAGNIELCDPLPPVSLLNQEGRTFIQSRSIPQFHAQQLNLTAGSPQSPSLFLGGDIAGFGGLAEYLLTGKLAGRREALNPRPFEDRTDSHNLSKFIDFCRQAPTSDQLHADSLTIGFSMAVPLSQALEEGNPSSSLKFKDREQVYLKVARGLRRYGLISQANRQRLAHLAETMGLDERDIRSLEKTLQRELNDGRSASDSKEMGKAPKLKIRSKSTGPSGSHWAIDALMFPIRHWFTTIFLSALMWITVYLTWSVLVSILSRRRAGSFFVSLAIFCCLLLAGYFAGFVKNIINDAVAGETSNVTWPSITSLWEDIAEPFLQVGAAILSCLIPTMTYMILFKYTGTWSPGLENYFRELFSGNSLQVVTGFTFLGICWLPIALLAISVYDSIASLNPLPWLVLFPRIALDYLVMLSFFLVLSIGVGMALFSVITAYGPVMSWMVVPFVIGPGAMIFLRGVGLFYFRNEDVFFHYSD